MMHNNHTRPTYVNATPFPSGRGQGVSFVSVLLYLLLFLFPLTTDASSYRFRHITSGDGLPHQQVEALAQDAKGNIWIGTRNGLACYDGYEMRSYFHDKGDSTSLNHNFVRHLFVDYKGRIWICTQNGLCRYRPETDDFKSYAQPRGVVSAVVQTSKGTILCGGDELCVYDEQHDSFKACQSPESGFIISMVVDRHDNIFMATNQSIFYCDESVSKVTTLDPSCYASFLTHSDDILPLFFDSRQRLWIGRNGQGAECVTLSANGHVDKVEIYPPDQLSNGTVRVINEDAQHRIWLGTEKGKTVIGPDGSIEILRQRLENPALLNDNDAVYSIICDRNNNIWMGSYFGGIDVLLTGSRPFEWIEPGYRANQIKSKVPRMMVETQPNVFWVATEDGGLNIYNAEEKVCLPFDKLPAIGTNVHSLYYDKANREMWIGTFRSGLFRYRLDTGASRRYHFSNGLTSNSVFCFARQKNGRLWVATTQGLYYYDDSTDMFKLTGNTILDRQFVYTLCVDRNDNLWAGTNLYGLFRIDSKMQKIENWRAGAKDGLADDYVTCLCQDSKGVLWIGTNNNGLQYFDLKTNKIETVTDDALLSKTTVCSIIEDNAHRLWISTSQGLFRYSPDNHSLQRFTTENGLPTNQFNFSSSLLASNGKMFFGTVEGLVSFDPMFSDDRSSPFVVHLKRLIINNKAVTVSAEGSPLKKPLDETETIVLSYLQSRSFSIEYGVILPAQNNNIEYQVRLGGVDKNWRDVGDERKFSGYNLPVGTYQLQIRANNTNEGWDDCPVTTLRIVVRPPFYLSTWAYLFYLLLAAVLAYLAYRFVTIRNKERLAIHEATVEKEKIEAIDKAKFDFFTTISHELKTPLSLIVAPLKTISRQELNESSRKNLDVAIKNTQKMESLINELITFNKVETDSSPFYVQKGNPLTFIDLLVATFRETASEKGLQLLFESENNGEEVWFSPSYVERIVSNLLSNAFKFTPSGGTISVKSRITTLEDNPDTYLDIIVSDTGIGIAKEEQNRIFDHYYQTKRGYNVNNSGWGIGLSLVKRLAEVHKGSVRVESEVGKGSSFYVLLNVSEQAYDSSTCTTEDKTIVPLGQDEFSQSSGLYGDDMMELSSMKPAEADTPTILLVDDNTDLLSFLASHFSDRYKVFTAENGRQALEIARSGQIQIVVSDVMMPEMDGFEFCRCLKQDMLTSHIPVILLTAKSEQDDVVSGYESGAEVYVSKPFDPQILDLQIKNILQLQKVRQGELVNTNDQDIDSTSLSQLDKQFMHNITQLVDDNIANSDFAISDITTNLGISRSLLHTKMKNLAGMSMGDYIRKRRLDKACQLLHDGYNVSETAYRTGFSDPSYFSKTFKKHIGISPTEYINERNQSS